MLLDESVCRELDSRSRNTVRRAVARGTNSLVWSSSGEGWFVKLSVINDVDMYCRLELTVVPLMDIAKFKLLNRCRARS